MNFAELKSQVKDLTGRNDSEFDDRIEKALNRAYRDWARMVPWEGLRQVGDVTHNGGRHLVLPAEVDRVIWLLDKTNYRDLDAGDGQWDRRAAYSYAADIQGYADEWELAGHVPVFTDVSGPLEIYTSAASDVVTVYCQGQVLDPSGSAPHGLYRYGESVNIAGTTPVTTSSNWWRMDAITKDADTTGVLTVKSQGTIVGYIDPFERSPAYCRVRFMDIPATGTQFKYEAYCKPVPLVSDYQTTDPSVEQDFLIWAASADIHWQLREGARGTAARRRADRVAAEHADKEKMFGDWSGRMVPEDLT